MDAHSISRLRIRSPGLVVLLFALIAAQSARARPLTFEAGFQLDYFSESYGQGDLFSDLDETPSLEPSIDEIPIRIRSNTSLPGAYFQINWLPANWISGRRARFSYEQNEASAVGRFDGTFTLDLGSTWRIAADERFRVEQGLRIGDASEDILQNLELRLLKQMGSHGSMELSARHELSQVSGDSLSSIYDYEVYGLGTKLTRPLFGAIGRLRADWAFRDSPGSHSGSHHRLRAGLDLYRYGLSGLRYDLAALVTRRTYDGGLLIDPSVLEGEVLANVVANLSSEVSVIFDGEYRAVTYDIPDDIYYDYLTGRTELRLGWTSLSGASISVGGGGEWLRPQALVAPSYDQSRVSVKVGYLGAGRLWFDLEQAIGVRSYFGGPGTGGLISGLGSLGFEASDFTYTELTFLVGQAWRLLELDAFGQWTVENHEVTGDDVSFFLLNLRLGVHF